MRTSVRPVQLYFPIERVLSDNGDCIVEGYAFVNEVVPGEGGVRVKRSAMEAATPDYMRFANIREMHGRNAAGVALSATWDDAGCLMRAKIVDPVARIKCEEGVYKGFSIGVQPTLMRGKDVETLSWLETSLVDRPKDPGALFTAYRADGFDPDAEGECDVLDSECVEVEADSEPTSRISADELASLEAQRVANVARVAALSTDGADPAAGESTDRVDEPAHQTEVVVDPEAPVDTEERGLDTTDVPTRENLEPNCPVCGKSCTSCKMRGETMEAACEYVADPEKPPVSETDLETTERILDEVVDNSIATINRLSEENTALIERAETAEAEIARVQEQLSVRDGELTQAREQIERLMRTPDPHTVANRPIRFQSFAASREFLVNRGNEREASRLELESKLADLAASASTVGTNPEAQNRLAIAINVLKQQITDLS